MTRNAARVLGVASLVGCAWCWAFSPGSLQAQDLPPELTGDYTNRPPPQPAPTPRQPARPPAPTPTAEPEFDPELGDAGPVPEDTDASAEDTDTFGSDATEVELESEIALDAPIDDDATPPQSQQWSVGLGFGVGTLAFTRPAAGGAQRLATSPYAAMDIDVRGWLGAQHGLSFGILARYQTSLGWALQHDPLFALPETIATRSQALELSVAPTFRLADSVHLAFPLGAAMRWLVAEVHQYPLEPYTLVSVLLRAELIAALSDTVTLRVGPEAHAILFVNRALEREGACCSGGALGGQASLQARLSETFSLGLDYRESRALIPAAARFSAVERLVTARFSGEL